MTAWFKQLDIDSVISSLTIKEKAKLLAGKSLWHFEDNERVGIPSVRVSDGPNGLRGQKFFNSTPAACFPSATSIGASFDVKLVHEVGVSLGEECIAKGAHVLLGPTANMHRLPLGGRGFESFAEDLKYSDLHFEVRRSRRSLREKFRLKSRSAGEACNL
ncbi:hypothetical protein T439DRAFT_22703 [Meredithblackwellia eburnea MCA 4105]